MRPKSPLQVILFANEHGRLRYAEPVGGTGGSDFELIQRCQQLGWIKFVRREDVSPFKEIPQWHMVYELTKEGKETKADCVVHVPFPKDG
jgi:hypothetical protein